jgi:hypothetical protein
MKNVFYACFSLGVESRQRVNIMKNRFKKGPISGAIMTYLPARDVMVSGLACDIAAGVSWTRRKFGRYWVKSITGR